MKIALPSHQSLVIDNRRMISSVYNNDNDYCAGVKKKTKASTTPTSNPIVESSNHGFHDQFLDYASRVSDLMSLHDDDISDTLHLELKRISATIRSSSPPRKASEHEKSSNISIESSFDLNNKKMIEIFYQDDDAARDGIDDGNNKGNKGMLRTRSVFDLCDDSMSSVSTESSSTTTVSSYITKPQETKWFDCDVLRQHIKAIEQEDVLLPVHFTKKLHQIMEPHLQEARRMRTSAQRKRVGNFVIDESKKVPYTSLRSERPFLFDVSTYPIHQVLAETIGVQDLSMLHKNEIQDKRFLMAPVLDQSKRRAFHECYDNFVTSFCIPLLHSMAMTKNVFHTTSPTASTKIVYRYQAFPCIQVVRPGEFSAGPHCDVAKGHGIGTINFHVPLTAAFGTNAMYTESKPGKEDWHPLTSKSGMGLGHIFDGARCLHFSLENMTEQTRVSLSFRVSIHREDYSTYRDAIDGGLCTKEMLNDDQYANAGPGYYDEAIIDIGVDGKRKTSSGPVVVKRNDTRLLNPDKRNGFPFTKEFE